MGKIVVCQTSGKDGTGVKAFVSVTVKTSRKGRAVACASKGGGVMVAQPLEGAVQVNQMETEGSMPLTRTRGSPGSTVAAARFPLNCVAVGSRAVAAEKSSLGASSRKRKRKRAVD